MRLLAIFFSITLLACEGRSATLIGSVVDISRELPSEDFYWGPVPVFVTGTESDRTSVSDGDNMAIMPQATSIVFILGPEGGAGGGAEDHRMLVSNIQWFGEPDLEIASISVTSDLPDFDPGLVTFDGHSVSLWIGSLEWNGGETVEVTLTPTAVPEPSTVFLLAGALVCGVCLRLQRRRAEA